MKKLLIFSLTLMMAATAVSQQPAKTPAKTGKKRAPAAVKKAPTQQEIDAAILEELKQIKQLLADQNKYINARAVAPQRQQQPVAAKVKLKVDPSWHALGSDNAPITVVEFADYQCPFCRKFQSDTYAQFKKELIDSGKVRFVSSDLPLPFHEHSMKAAEAARCAGDQGKFWEMRDILMGTTADLADASIDKYAATLSLNADSFDACLKTDKYKKDIEQQAAAANQLSISGTPSFVIAKTAKDTLDGVTVVGALPYAAFQSQIDGLLKPPAAKQLAAAKPVAGGN
jgi:protein-disulfide isomerase